MGDQLEQAFYALLGVTSQASSSEIEAAYRRLAQQLHPDSGTDEGEDADADAEEKYQMINRAYAVIGDPIARAEYDRECRARAGLGTIHAGGVDPLWVAQLRARAQENQSRAAHVDPPRHWWQRRAKDD